MQSGAKMNCKFLPYDPRLKTVARMLRNNMTLAEILLWNQLKQNGYSDTISIVRNQLMSMLLTSFVRAFRCY